jgi:hypothetical protein
MVDLTDDTTDVVLTTTVAEWTGVRVAIQIRAEVAQESTANLALALIHVT